ncbi:chorismate mutase [Shimazuella alba]|uniref:Chorismate mutase n=1 Tax=Shimazuella alba TaxID=2690964 RepID=A0A6I4VVH0_9BACL|nr:chorismate mutase [Shimazuella alba]MXQ55899.1 chorismate mutase [Shimazuella alba]
MATDELVQIRNQIDEIDEQVIKLIAKRYKLVKQAAYHKTNQQDVAAPARVEQVIAKVKKIADKNGMQSSIVEELYRKMIARFIEEERKEFEEFVSLGEMKNNEW